MRITNKVIAQLYKKGLFIFRFERMRKRGGNVEDLFCQILVRLNIKEQLKNYPGWQKKGKNNTENERVLRYLGEKYFAQIPPKALAKLIVRNRKHIGEISKHMLFFYLNKAVIPSNPKDSASSKGVSFFLLETFVSAPAFKRSFTQAV